MMQQIIIGILSGVGTFGVMWLLQEFKRVLNASTKNEMVKIKRKNIKYFWPSILSLFVFVFEIYANSPNSIIPVIDAVFVFLSVTIILMNVFLVIIIGDQEVRTNENVNRYLSLERKFESAEKRHRSIFVQLKKNNAELRIVIENRPDLFPRSTLDSLIASEKDVDDFFNKQIGGNSN
jgi:hypothetical protein